MGGGGSPAAAGSALPYMEEQSHRRPPLHPSGPEEQSERPLKTLTGDGEMVPIERLTLNWEMQPKDDWFGKQKDKCGSPPPAPILATWPLSLIYAPPHQRPSSTMIIASEG